MVVKLVEFKNNLDKTFIEMLKNLIKYIKENPDEIKNLTVIIQSVDDTIRVLNNIESAPVNLIGQLELAKVIVINNIFDNLD